MKIVSFSSIDAYMRSVLLLAPASGLHPDLLLHPNIPKPLHGLNPRTIKGREWWDERRHEAYAAHDYRCWACGIHKSETRRRWLEGHEYYGIDYAAGRAEMAGVAALCHTCHSFIHNGKLFIGCQNGETHDAEILRVLHHGFSILKKADLPPNPFALNVASRLAGQMRQSPKWLLVARDLASQYQIDTLSGDVVPWGQWRLVIDGTAYPPIWASYEAWRQHYDT